MPFICYNGYFVEDKQPVIAAADRGYRYGDGFFETIKIFKGRIVLGEYHRNRIAKTIELLHYSLPGDVSVSNIFGNILALCRKNNCYDLARVRLSFSNGEGDLFHRQAALNYLIEAYPFAETEENRGLNVGLFPEMKKPLSIYANIKSSNALIYSIAARYAQKKNWDDCLIVNENGNIAESTISNIFWIKGSQIYTPPLTEGCIDGVLRAYLLDTMNNIIQKPCETGDIENADEVFLTNVIRGLRWVASFDEVSFKNETSHLFKYHIQQTLQQ